MVREFKSAGKSKDVVGVLEPTTSEIHPGEDEAESEDQGGIEICRQEIGMAMLASRIKDIQVFKRKHKDLLKLPAVSGSLAAGEGKALNNTFSLLAPRLPAVTKYPDRNPKLVARLAEMGRSPAKRVIHLPGMLS